LWAHKKRIFQHELLGARAASDAQRHLLDLQDRPLGNPVAAYGREGKPQGIRHDGAQVPDPQPDPRDGRLGMGKRRVLYDLQETLGYGKFMHQRYCTSKPSLSQSLI
jgi:hypothetical protein